LKHKVIIWQVKLAHKLSHWHKWLRLVIENS